MDDIPVEIKAVEGEGMWAVSTKLREAEKQHAQSVILYFPDSDKYSEERIREGIRLYQTGIKSNNLIETDKILVIVQNELVAASTEKTTLNRVANSGRFEGTERESPLTIPPSDAKV